MSSRTVAFIDALNLYYGMRDEGLHRFRWLNVEGLAQSLAVDAGGELGRSLRVEQVIYCTSMVANKQSARRQDIYLQALEEHCSSIQILKGNYEMKERTCENCGTAVGFQTEKQTDVNLAVEMVRDAAKPVGERAEVQLLVTGDTDLLPAVRAVRSYGVEVIVIAPPSRGITRHSFNPVASKYLRVFHRHVRDNQMPELVMRPTADGDGYPLRAPDGWTVLAES